MRGMSSFTKESGEEKDFVPEPVKPLSVKELQKKLEELDGQDISKIILMRRIQKWNRSEQCWEKSSFCPISSIQFQQISGENCVVLG